MFAKHFAKNSIPTKIGTKKNDAAPMICFIDVLHSKNFPYFIIPEPCRIDKLINGAATALIFPSKRAIVLHEDEDTGYTFNYQSLFQAMLSNFVHYAKLKSKEILYRELPPKKITTWWNQTISQEPQILSYTEDLEYILQTFLEAYVAFKGACKQHPAFSEEEVQKQEMLCLLDYCNKMVDYFTKRIESNLITIQYKKKTIEKRMYKVKKQKKTDKENYYPDIFEFDLIQRSPNNDRLHHFQKAFIPVMIYDDILESFFFNQEILERKLGIDEPEKNSAPGDPEKDEEIFDIDTVSVIHFTDLEQSQLFHTFPKGDQDSLPKLETEIGTIKFSDFVKQ